MTSRLAPSAAKVELLAILLGAGSLAEALNSHYARGFGVCIFSAYTLAFVLIAAYTTPLTTFVHLTSPGLQSSSAYRHACRLHYVVASVAYLTVLVYLVTHNDGMAREAVRYRVVLMSMVNMFVYCLLAFLT
ncbi:hypothetical protein MRX96_033040 [Rhipicephalus microplus]|uniref:Uncharacterized protein n=1 Tax=Rhipicephalus microplus TaxID=6941 RepID=A0A9J6EQ41_RHIMP|nr:hypothetical protein HPB51_024885 [Rhipicephalus microplus]